MIELTKENFSEVYEIINHLTQELRNKIPSDFVEFVSKNKDNNYVSEIDFTKNINEQKISKETRAILAIIYRDFLCTKEEKKKLIKEDEKYLLELEKTKSEKYSQDNLFKKDKINKEEVVEQEQTWYPVVVKPKVGIIKKIIKKIISFFKG